jgi:hypothetical protein
MISTTFCRQVLGKLTKIFALVACATSDVFSGNWTTTSSYHIDGRLDEVRLGFVNQGTQTTRAEHSVRHTVILQVGWLNTYVV